MKRKLIALLSLVMAGSVVLTSCGADTTADEGEGKEATNSEQNAESNKTKEIVKAEDPSKLPDVAKNRKDTLIVGTTDPKGNFNPIYTSTKYDSWVTALVFSGLVGNDEKGNPTPEMVESVDNVVSKDGKTYTFNLKKGIKFSNGEEVTAKDVQFTYTAICDPNYDGARTDAVESLVGYDEYKKGDAKDVAGIKVIDDHTISFTLKDVKASALISDFGYGIMPKSVYNFEKGNIQVLKDKMKDRVVIGSGPYKFVEFKPGENVSFEKNDTYFKGAPEIPKIIMKVTNAKTNIQELQSGNVDIDLIPTNDKNITMLKSAGFLDLNFYPQNGYGYIGFNLRDKKFEDKKVRQALAYGLDRKGFLENYYGQYAIPGDTHCSPVSWAYPKEGELNKYEFNPEKAKELLDEAGWKMNESTGIREKDGEALKFSWMTYTDSKYVDSLIPIVKENWKAIGVEVVPELMEFSTLSQKVNDNRDFEMFNMAWSMSIDPDPSGIFSKSQDMPGGHNSVGWHPEKSDELMEKGLKTTDQAERTKIYGEWFKLVNDELPYIFLGTNKELRVSSSRVKNFDVSTYMEWYSNIHLMELAQD